MRTRAAILLATSLFIALSTPAARAQEKVLLKDITAVGDVSDADDQMTTSFEIKLSAPGQAEQSVKMSHGEREQYRTRVLATSAGSPTVVRRTYTLSESNDTDPSGTKKRVSSLQGKTVTARRVGTNITVTVDKGKLDPEDMKKARELVKGEKVHFLPGREVAVGEEWTIDPEQAKKDLEGAETVVAKGKLSEIVDYMGHRCARIGMSFDATGKFGTTPIPMHLVLTGDGYYALDLKRTVALQIGGPITAQGETEQNGAKIPFTMAGKMEGHHTQKWISVGK